MVLVKAFAVVIALWITATGAAAAPMAPGAAVSEARSLGAATNTTTRADINATKQAATVPPAPAPRDCMPASATVETYYGGGNGDLATPTGPLLTTAAGGTTPECAAINFMQGRGAWVNPLSIHPLDPLVLGGRAIQEAPAPSLGPTMGIFVPRTTSSCAPGSTTTGGGATEEACYEYASIADATCESNWVLTVVPWWTYTCNKSPFILVDQTCTKEEWVTVDLVENCTVGTSVGSADIPWGYRFQSGADLYTMGGYARAMCNPALASEVQLNFAVLNVSEGAFGSGATYSPEPNRALIPPMVSVELPTNLTTTWTRPGATGSEAFIAVLAGSSCDATGSCTYTGFAGAQRYTCSGPMTRETCTGDPYNGYTCSKTQVSDAEGHESTGALGDPGFGYGSVVYECMSPTPLGNAVWNSSDPTNAFWDCASVPGTLGIFDVGAGMQCFGGTGTLSMVGPGTGAKPFTLVFDKPRLVPTITAQGVNSTCAALESNPSCTAMGSRCVDGVNETRVINGLGVIRSCWRSEHTFQCRSGTGPNHCTPLESEPTCAQLGVDGCVAYAADGVTCTTYKANYKCTTDMGPPPDVTQTGAGYEITQDSLDSAACSAYSTNPSCTKTSSVCVDTADKTFFGFTFSRACWKYQDSYTCSAAGANNCGPLISAGCTVIPTATTCTSTLPDGSCGSTQYVYQCGTPATTTTTGSTCDSTPYCINGICYDTSRPGDPDFGQAIAMSELARQAGTYIDQATFEIFKGSPSMCRRKLFGINNCCKNTSGSGADWRNSAMYQAFNFGKQFLGSSYVYDQLFMSDMPNMVLSALESLGAVAWSGPSSFSAYGITIGWSGGELAITGFDPWSFAISIAVQLVLSELMSCPDSDKLTAMKRAQGICEFVGSYCSSKFLGSCVTRKEGYCCYNSKLAKAINVQGKAQLGMTLGTPQNPDCKGLTVAEVQSLDFSRIDLSEFIASLTPGSTTSAAATTSVVNRLTTYAPVPPVTGAALPPGTPPPPTTSPPPPPADWAEPTVTASWSANPTAPGSVVTLTTNTANATSLSYDCTGAWTTSGVLATGSASTALTVPAGTSGTAFCMFTASNPSIDVVVQANIDILPSAPSVSASFSPATVPAGSSYTFSANSANADSVTWSCSGSRVASGSIPVGPYTSAPTVALGGEVGTVTCTFTARQSSTGAQASVSVVQTVTAVTPTVSAVAAASPITAGSPLVVNTTTTNAVSLSYSCTGAMTASGALAVGSDTLNLPTTIANVGTAVCVFTATSASGETAVQPASVVINP